jgi:hypothetical protein
MLDSKNVDHDFEEMHYYHVLKSFLDLLVSYGWTVVIKDLIALQESEEWF